jgi:hypothetical protein
MKKTNNIFFILLFFFIAVTSCQSLKDGLTGTKKQNSDEFLIEKKNPLTKPPDYEKLPNPEIASVSDKVDNDEFDLKKLLGQTQKQQGKKNQDSSLNKSILDKIKQD